MRRPCHLTDEYNIYARLEAWGVLHASRSNRQNRACAAETPTRSNAWARAREMSSIMVTSQGQRMKDLGPIYRISRRV
jgi:hypothetical protein